MTEQKKCIIMIHKNNIEKRICIDEIESYLTTGWKKGISKQHRSSLSKSHMNQPAWNKGIPMSKKAKEKLSASTKGKIPWNKNKSAKNNAVIKASIEKSVKTKIKKFGNGFGNNNMSEAHKKKISEATRGKKKHFTEETLRIKLNKDYITKKKNNSFNTSKPEEEFYEWLLKENVNKTIYRQYKDSRYPFYCDFYILEDDLFIELNLHWTHGGKPFDINDKECLNKLAIWKEKAKTSKFYKNAIETWTVRDLNKQHIAKENNLNYKVIYQ